MAYLGPLPSKDSKLVGPLKVDRRSRIKILKSITAEKAVGALNRILCMHGYPQSITTNNGPQFIRQAITKYIQEHGIHHRKVTLLWPVANGEAERQNR